MHTCMYNMYKSTRSFEQMYKGKGHVGLTANSTCTTLSFWIKSEIKIQHG